MFNFYDSSVIGKIANSTSKWLWLNVIYTFGERVTCFQIRLCGWRGLLKKLEIFVFLDSDLWTSVGQAGVSFRH